MRALAHRLVTVAVISAALTAASPSAWAHHSFAMFDAQKSVTLEGTIKEFQWTNPHTWVQIVAKDAAGNAVEWSIEGASPNALARAGWKRNSLKPGDKAVIVMHPLKDGTNGGSLVTASVGGVVVGGAR